MSWCRDVCRQLARLSHLLHPLSSLSSYSYMLVVRFFTESRARSCFLLVAWLIWTLQSTLTLLSVLYLCFLFVFLLLHSDPNNSPPMRFVMEMPHFGSKLCEVFFSCILNPDRAWLLIRTRFSWTFGSWNIILSLSGSAYLELFSWFSSFSLM